ncbi:MAG: hypothetical protein NT013_20075 [Planctomycetia bacterium]|nr:hypothetical protein [Planctomycetia bacterium]
MSDVNFSDPRTQFAARYPSSTWECFPLAVAPQCFVWAWFKPAHVPQGLILSVPDETFPAFASANSLTLRMLLTSAGIDPSCVAMWVVFGLGHDAQGGSSPLLDVPILPPPLDVDRNIVVYIQPSVVMPAPVANVMPTQITSTSSAELYERIGTDWNSCLQLEKELDSMRKQLSAMASKLHSLNRDLTPEETLHAARQDQDDWKDARRWLREAAGKLSRFIKECDVGDTVYVGKKKWFIQIYQQVIVPRQPHPNLEQVRQEFEAHRKTLQTLVNNMRATHSSAGQDGERRAQQVLSRIAAKTASARTKR